MHWSTNIGWDMATYMHEVVVNKTRNLVPFFVMRSQLVTKNHGFPYMHMWLKVGKEFLCIYCHNKWLMGPLQMT